MQHVLCAGAVYGIGEEIFVDAFKACWEGSPAPMPLLASNGENVLPTVHADDLVEMIARLLSADVCPLVAEQTRHMLAIDNGRNTLQQLLSSVSAEMSSGEVITLSEDETLLLSNNDIVAIHQVMEPAAADVLMKGKWTCREGLVANISKVVEQFKKAHHLSPCRMVVHGPPLSGKTRLVDELSSYYGIPVVDIQAAIAEAAQMPEEQRLMPEWAELMTEGEEGEKAFTDIKEVPLEVLQSVVQWKLSDRQYVCRGWILDSFPDTKSYATAIFAVPPPEVPEGEDPPEVEEGTPPELDQRFCPTNVVWLECDEEQAMKRFEALEDVDRKGPYADEETFREALAAYNTLQDGAAGEAGGKPAKGAAPTEPEASARVFFEQAAQEGLLLCTQPGTWPDTSQAIREAVGPPKNFKGPGHLLSDDWVEPVEEVIVDNPLPVPPKIAAIRKRNSEKEANKATEEEVAENRALFEGATPLREHLLQVAMPAVTESLVLACEEQPADPIDFVRKFLFDYEERDNRAKVAKSREIKAKAKADVAKAKADQEKAKRDTKAKK